MTSRPTTATKKKANNAPPTSQKASPSEAFFCAATYTQLRAWGIGIKKLIVSRQPILINLKSNTMKNTLQRYRVLTNPQA